MRILLCLMAIRCMISKLGRFGYMWAAKQLYTIILKNIACCIRRFSCSRTELIEISLLSITHNGAFQYALLLYDNDRTTPLLCNSLFLKTMHHFSFF